MIEQIVNVVQNPVVILILLTFIPFLELRASIPYGILVLQMNWVNVFLICIITNIILGPIIYWFLHLFIGLFLKVKFIDKIWQRYVERLQKRIKPYVERWGVLGVGLFIGIPLPGSGSYSGAIGSYVLGLNFRKFFWANVLGVLIAGTVVTIISLAGNSAWSFLIKVV
ncbi:small multi-drug export protein [Candidatus Woesearchaeota archaeon]|nr:small multi-drug export protein [Candidatus Woesearchaeota archaeon]